VLCLQEVSARTIGALLERELDKLGYEIAPNAYYDQKSDITKWSRRALANNHHFWSVMTAFKKDKFRQVDQRELNYYYVNYY